MQAIKEQKTITQNAYEAALQNFDMAAEQLVQIGREVHKAELPLLVRNLLKEEFFSKVCGVRIVHLGRPQLFLRPHVTEQYADAEPESTSEKIFDMIINA